MKTTPVNPTEEALRLTLNELSALRENLTAAQGRCGVLVEECRTLRREKTKLYELLTRLTSELPSRELYDVPRVVRDMYDIEDEPRQGGIPAEIDQRLQHGYVPMPTEKRRVSRRKKK
jgi:hypothetical protein